MMGDAMNDCPVRVFVASTSNRSPIRLWSDLTAFHGVPEWLIDPNVGFVVFQGLFDPHGAERLLEGLKLTSIGIE